MIKKTLSAGLPLLLVLVTVATFVVQGAQPQAIAFTNVNVIPFDRERILAGQTVVVAKGELIGPTIYTAGPPLLGNNVPTPEVAERVVVEQKKAGYDLLKVHEGLSPETYAAIVATANRERIPFAGHVTATVGLKRALDAHQTSIEHLDGYLQAMVADDSPVKPTGSQVVGPDSPQFFLVPGFGTHRELESFVEAGLSPYAAIEAATRNPGEYFAEVLKAPRDFGTVEVGMRADLVLLDANPLQSVANLSKRTGVMVRGRWFPETELRKMLEKIAALNGAKVDFSGTWTLDKNNSEGLPPGMDQLMTVVLTGDKLSLETKLITDK